MNSVTQNFFDEKYKDLIEIVVYFNGNTQEFEFIRHTGNVTSKLKIKLIVFTENLQEIWITDEDTNEEATEIAKQLREEGNDFHKKGLFKQAIEKYEKALEISFVSQKEKAFIHGNCSAAYFMLEDYQKSLHNATIALKLAPNWPRAFYRKANVLYKLGELQKALKCK